MNDGPGAVLPGTDGPAGAAPGLTHADWFSGIGGFALAFGRAGFDTVSFSEIEPFPIRVLRTHWPDVEQLGDITKVADRWRVRQPAVGEDLRPGGGSPGSDGTGEVGRPTAAGGAGVPADAASLEVGDADRGGTVDADPDEESAGRPADDAGGEAGGREGSAAGRGAQPDGGAGEWAGPLPAWATADVWTGGTPCQDFSIAGRRGGLYNTDGTLTRSGLALVWLDLIERFKPRWIVWENVPGLLSSNEGRDMAALLRALEQLGYGWAFRTLDAQEFGVPQRRRRVLTVAALGDPLAIGPRAVLALTEGEGGDLGSGSSAGQEPAAGARGGPVIGFDVAGPLTKRYAKGINTTIDDGAVVVQREAPDADRVRAAARIPSGLDDPEGLEVFRKSRRAQNNQDDETWVPAEASNTLNQFDDGSDVRATHLVYQQQGSKVGPLGTLRGHNHTNGIGFMVAEGFGPEDDLLPKRMDSSRYKALGNAVAVPVVEWIARRLRAYIEANP